MRVHYLLIAIIVPYLIGSVPFAVWIGQIFYKKDVREEGSGNAGATNVYRVLGLYPAAIVFLLDGAKGAAAVLLCRSFHVGFPWITVAALFVMLGHAFPLYARFSGGKGVSTAAGILVLVNPAAFLLALFVFGLIVWNFRLVSVASISAAGVAFITVLVQLFFFRENWTAVSITGLLLMLILISHRTNLRRLKSGKELKI
ncbi:MAG: acyl-phosphate glycerol 3-phosphate acyltransferase [Acidobacteria bacterium]|nr:MAG: acyl-phosphate glycerol 3-phosphate acyltransferase [Acidobacteriota bacterium]